MYLVCYESLEEEPGFFSSNAHVKGMWKISVIQQTTLVCLGVMTLVLTHPSDGNRVRLKSTG